MKGATSIYGSNFGTYTSKILMNRSGYLGLARFLFDPNTSQTFEKWLTNFDNNAIISMYFIPIDLSYVFQKMVDAGVASSSMFEKLDSVNVLDTTIKVSSMTSSNPILYKIDPEITNKRFYGGSLYVNRKYGNFYDFEPYTKYQLYIPVIGVIDLPASQIIGRFIDIFYTIDFEQMTITAIVNSRSSGSTQTTGQSDECYQIAKASAGWGVQIALNGEDRSQMMMNRISSFGSVVTDVGLAGMSGGLSATKLAGDITNMLRPARSISSGVSGNGISAFYDDTYPYLICTYPRIQTDDELNRLAETSGRATNRYATSILRDMVISGDETKYAYTGYIQIEDLHYTESVYDGLTAITASELNELKTLLATGVYIYRDSVYPETT